MGTTKSTAAAGSSIPASPHESEKSFQAAVIELARVCGWRVWHTHNSTFTEAGEPDLRLLRAPRLIYAELKTATGRARPEQRAVLADLAQVPGIEVYLSRPADWDAIVAVLRGDGGCVGQGS